MQNLVLLYFQDHKNVFINWCKQNILKILIYFNFKILILQKYFILHLQNTSSYTKHWNKSLAFLLEFFKVFTLVVDAT